MSVASRELLSGSGPVGTFFELGEFTCRCGCNRALVWSDLVAVLDDARRAIAAPIRIVSGYRCPVQNLACNGKCRSWHTLGAAADIAVAPEHRVKLGRFLRGLLSSGRVRFAEFHPTFAHVDVGFE